MKSTTNVDTAENTPWTTHWRKPKTWWYCQPNDIFFNVICNYVYNINLKFTHNVIVGNLQPPLPPTQKDWPQQKNLTIKRTAPSPTQKAGCPAHSTSYIYPYELIHRLVIFSYWRWRHQMPKQLYSFFKMK